MRHYYDLGHNVLQVGKLGRIQTLCWLPVVAGDSLEISLEAMLRLSPLKRALIMNARTDVHAFYVPHRHIYGDDFVQFLMQGVDENITFDGSGTLKAEPVPIWLKHDSSTSVPKFLSAGLNRIWNRYYRDPRDDLMLPDNWTPAHAGTTGRPANWTSLDNNAIDATRYGYKAARLENFASDLNAYESLDTSDHQIDMSGNTATFDLIDVDQLRRRYETEIDREWFVERYTDLLDRFWGTGVNIDADERPVMLYSHTQYASGMDIDATDDAGLGRVLGKAGVRLSFSMPRRFFNEHGCVWVLMVVRMPPIYLQEQPWWLQQDNYSYQQFAGDPEIMGGQRPVELNAQHIYADGSNVDLGKMAYGDQWRMMTNYVHPRYAEVQGFGLIPNSPASVYDASYDDPDDWEQMFQSTPLEHWNLVGRMAIGKHTRIPGVKSSIYAGA